MASDCPNKVTVCNNCKKEGHTTIECKDRRVVSLSHIADKVPEDAWKDVKQASDERDLDDFKEVSVTANERPETRR